MKLEKGSRKQAPPLRPFVECGSHVADYMHFLLPGMKALQMLVYQQVAIAGLTGLTAVGSQQLLLMISGTYGLCLQEATADL